MSPTPNPLAKDKTSANMSDISINSWPRRNVEMIFAIVLFKLIILHIDILNTSCEISLSWVPQNPIDGLVNIGSGKLLGAIGNK